MAGKAIHGLSYTSEYRAWQTMRLRCTVPTNKAYPDYGGRGITVCGRWLNSVQAFIDDMGPKPSPRHELDREDNNGNYEPGNCRWVTRKVNDRNRRSARLLSAYGETLCLAEWSERFGVLAGTISDRMALGWPAERAVSEAARNNAEVRTARRPKQPCAVCGKVMVSKTHCRVCAIKSRSLSERGFLAQPQYRGVAK